MPLCRYVNNILKKSREIKDCKEYYRNRKLLIIFFINLKKFREIKTQSIFNKRSGLKVWSKSKSRNLRCLNLNSMKSKLTMVPQFPNLDLARNLFEWSVLSAHKKWRQMWNINPAFMLGSLVLHSSVLGKY